MTALRIFGIIYRQTIVSSVLGSLLYALLLVTLIYISDQEKIIKENYFFLILVSVIQLLLLTAWGSRLRLFINSYQSKLLPNFNRIIWSVFLFIIIVTALIPIILVAHLNWIDLNICIYVLFLSIVLLTISSYSQSWGSATGILLVMFANVEKARIKKHPDAEFFDYLPVDINVLMVMAIVVCLFGFYWLLNRSVIQSSKSQNAKQPEFVMYCSNQVRFSMWIGQFILRLKYFINGKISNKLPNRLSISLWSQQNWGITFFRSLILLIAVISFYFDGDFFRGFVDGLDKRELQLMFLFALLGMLAGFDHSIFSRIAVAEQFTWLREPIDGFESFKNKYFVHLLKMSLFEVLMTTGTYYLVLIQASENNLLISYLMVSFLLLKFSSMIISYAMVHYQVKGFGKAFIVMIYIVLISIWIFYTMITQHFEVQLIATLLIMVLTVLVLGIWWIKKTHQQRLA